MVGQPQVPPASHGAARRASAQPGLLRPAAQARPRELLSGCPRAPGGLLLPPPCPCGVLQGLNPRGGGTGRCDVHAGSQLVVAALAPGQRCLQGAQAQRSCPPVLSSFMSQKQGNK